jgi:PAS domain S-box-containing protein
MTKRAATAGRRVSRILAGYAIAVGSIGLAVVVRLAIDPGLGDHLPYVTFFIAVAITTWFGGLGPSLAAVVLGALAANWVFMSPRHTLWIAGSMHQVGYAAYFAIALSIVGLGEAWRKSQRRAETLLTNLRTELSARERMEEELRRSEAHLAQELADTKILQSTSAELVEEGRIEMLYRKVVDAAVGIMRADFASMQRFHPDRGQSGELQLLAYRGFDDEAAQFWEWVRPASDSACGLALRSRRQVVVPNVETCGFMAGTDDLATYLRTGVRAVQTTPLLSRDGRLLGMLSTHWREPHQPSPEELQRFDILARMAADVMARQQTEAALRESEEQFRTLADGAPALIWVNDLEGCQFVNRGYLEFLGVGIPDVRGYDWAHFVHPHDRVQYVEAYRDAMKHEKIFDKEFRFCRHDGEYRWMHSVGQPRFTRDGTFAGYTGLTIDITERKAAEAALREAQERFGRWNVELEQVVNLKTAELVQSQQRLRALAAELNLSEQRERKRLATELHDHLQQTLVLGKLKLGAGKRHAVGLTAVEKIIQETDDVFSDALTYTRTLVAELSPTVLRDHGLDAGLKWLAEYMKKHEQTVTVTVPGSRGPQLAEHQVMLLFQSVRELLINSSKHAGTGEATVTMEQHEDNLSITVSDKGKGFDLAAAAAAAAAAGTPSGGISSKFGLYSIQERMRALGGSFAIESAPGQGTTAMLVLPLAREVEDHLATSGMSPVPVVRAAASAKKSDSPTKGQTMVHVLLVDDHAMVRQGLRSVLDAYDDLQVVAEARDGEEAIKLVGDLHPRVVVMDINMPKMNGIDATTYIKNHWPETTVIGISVNTRDGNSEAMKRAGAAAVLPKDTAVDQLHDAIVQEVGICTDQPGSVP